MSIVRSLRFSSIFQVGFYSIGFTVLDKLINPGEVGFRNLLAAVFPASATVWWYYTAYLILFFFIPYINYAINALTKRGFTALLVTVLLLFSVRPTIMLLYGADYIATYGGYTAVWLFALYVIGAYIRKNDIIHKSKTAFVILVYVLSFAITYYVPVILGTVNSLLGIEIPYVCLQEDPSPNILLMSVSMLVLFAKIRIPQCLFKVVEKLSALAFAVYIISEHPFVKKYIAAGNFEFIAEHPAILIPIECIVWSGAIYLLCCLLELLRLRLFKLVKMERAEACLTAVFEKVRPYAEHE